MAFARQLRIRELAGKLASGKFLPRESGYAEKCLVGIRDAAMRAHGDQGVGTGFDQAALILHSVLGCRQSFGKIRNGRSRFFRHNSSGTILKVIGQLPDLSSELLDSGGGGTRFLSFLHWNAGQGVLLHGFSLAGPGPFPKSVGTTSDRWRRCRCLSTAGSRRCTVFATRTLSI